VTVLMGSSAISVENTENENLFSVSHGGAIGTGTGTDALVYGTDGECLQSGGGSGELMNWGSCGGGGGGGLTGTGNLNSVTTWATVSSLTGTDIFMISTHTMSGDTFYSNVFSGGQIFAKGTLSASGAVSFETTAAIQGLLSVAIGIDGIGAVDIDYGSADITDHTFSTDGTGDSEIVLPDESISSTEITNDTIDFVDIKYDNTLAGNPALAVDECFWIATSGGGGFICEGSTADTAEQIYQFPDVNGSDTTDFIVVDNTETTGIDGTNLSISAGVLGVDDAFLVNDASDTMAGTLTADGLTLGANETLTLGAQTLLHNATDFVFNDSIAVNNLVTAGSLIYSDGTALQDMPASISGSAIFLQGTAAPRTSTGFLRTAIGFMGIGLSGTGVVLGTGSTTPIVMPFDFRIQDVEMDINESPFGASLIVDILEDNVTIFSTRPEIDAGAKQEDGNHIFSAAGLFLDFGDRIVLNVIQIGTDSGGAGTGLTVILRGLKGL